MLEQEKSGGNGEKLLRGLCGLLFKTDKARVHKRQADAGSPAQARAAEVAELSDGFTCTSDQTAPPSHL